MDIPLSKFNKGLLEYFEHYLENGLAAGKREAPTKQVINSLRRIVECDDLAIKNKSVVVTSKSIKVHVGHEFGPLGFKIAIYYQGIAKSPKGGKYGVWKEY